MTRTLLANRYVRLALVALVLLCGLLVLLAPATGLKTSGSTYSRAPEGYMGWFDYMQAQGTPAQRWRRPMAELLEQPPTAEPQTLLRIYPGLVNHYQINYDAWIQDWLSAGNTLIDLGLDSEITAAPFTTQQSSPFGAVTIKTRRRHNLPINSDRNLLGDSYGAIVWQRASDQPGKSLVVNTPHLAANAYLGAPGNYAFLADLATQGGGTIWVDEYLHGFKEADVIVAETVNNWGAYLAQTPVKVAAIQIAILLGIFLLSQNRRLGNLATVKAAEVDNSQAYIEALAAVLRKAESTSFLVDMIAKAERSSLQKALGFNEATTNEAALKAAWTQQTGQSDQILTPLTQPPKTTSPPSEATLKAWLAQLERIRQTPIR